MDNAAILSLIGIGLALLISAIKKVYAGVAGKPLDGGAALWLTFILCFVSAAGYLLFTGQIGAPGSSDPVATLEWIGAAYAVILGIATTLYKGVMSGETGVRALLTKKPT